MGIILFYKNPLFWLNTQCSNNLLFRFQVKDNTLKVCKRVLELLDLFIFFQQTNEQKIQLHEILFQVKAEEKLWQNRANQLLQRNDFGDETSNLEDTDSPDGGNNDIHNRNNNIDQEQT